MLQGLVRMLKIMKMDDKYLNIIVTSGEAAMFDKSNKFGKSFHRSERDEYIC